MTLQIGRNTVIVVANTLPTSALTATSDSRWRLEMFVAMTIAVESISRDAADDQKLATRDASMIGDKLPTGGVAIPTNVRVDLTTETNGHVVDAAMSRHGANAVMTIPVVDLWDHVITTNMRAATGVQACMIEIHKDAASDHRDAVSIASAGLIAVTMAVSMANIDSQNVAISMVITDIVASLTDINLPDMATTVTMAGITGSSSPATISVAVTTTSGIGTMASSVDISLLDMATTAIAAGTTGIKATTSDIGIMVSSVDISLRGVATSMDIAAITAGIMDINSRGDAPTTVMPGNTRGTLLIGSKDRAAPEEEDTDIVHRSVVSTSTRMERSRKTKCCSSLPRSTRTAMVR